MSAKKPLTCAELIALLQAESPDAIVWTAGCDCWDEAGGVVKQPDGTVLIERVGYCSEEGDS